MVQVNVGMYDHVYTTSQWSESLNWSMNKGFIPAQVEMEAGEFPPPCGTGTTTQTPVPQWSILQELHQQVLHVLFCTNLIATISGGWHSGKKSACQCRRRRRFGLDPLGREDPLENEIATHSLVARMVKNLPSKQDTWVRSPGRENPLEKGMATHSSILAWEIPWVEEPDLLQSMGTQSRTWLSTPSCKYTAENFSSPDPRNNQVNSLTATFQKHRIPTSPHMNKTIAKSITSQMPRHHG